MRESVRQHDHRDEVSALRRQIRELKERERSAFDRGFASALDMVERGATVEQVRAACRRPELARGTALARGTRDFPPAAPLVISGPEDQTIPMRVVEFTEENA